MSLMNIKVDFLRKDILLQGYQCENIIFHAIFPWQVQIYKVETNVHVKKIYRQIMNTIGSIPPESGEILG